MGATFEVVGFASPVEIEPEVGRPPETPARAQAVGFATGFAGFDEPTPAPPVSAPSPPAEVSQTWVAVEQPAEMIAAPHVSRTDIWVNDSSQVGWESVRDYVVSSIEARWGRWPRNPITEASIFKSFVGRWGDQSMRIAEYAVTVGQCSWLGAPLSVNRFTKGSDDVFGKVIAEKLNGGVA